MKFITDMGYSPVLTDETGKETRLGRYGVWTDEERPGKHDVIACGDDLAVLQAEHGPDLPLYVIVPGGFAPAPA